MGRGLSSLISQEALTSQPAAVVRVQIAAIDANPEQPRHQFDADDDFCLSIKQHGIISPLLVRRDGRRYVLIAGERRLRAARAVGLTEVPVLLRNNADNPAVQLELALVENLQRTDLNPIDAALGFQRLISQYGHTQEAVALAVGKERSTIANAVRLLKLPQEVLDAVREGDLSAGHARALLPLVGQVPAPTLDDAVQAVGSLSVRGAEALVRQLLRGETDQFAIDRQARLQAATPIAERLTERLSAEVSVRPRKQGGGRIVIDYTNADELQRLVAQLTSAT